MKLIHTADIHLDASYAGVPAAAAFGKRRRRRLREVFEEILNHGQNSGVEAVLIAGDLFDLERIHRDTVAFLQEEFIRIAPLPVFIAPGNHDPCLPGCPYVTERWPKNVHIFREPRWRAVELPDSPLTVHGFGYDGYEPSRNPFPELTLPKDGRIHVAVAHGLAHGLEGRPGRHPAPFDWEKVAQPGLSYLALGYVHHHVMLPASGGTVAAYSGAPEGHGFDDGNGQVFLEVEIETDGTVTARPVSSPRTRFLSVTVDCGGLTDSGQLIDAIQAEAGGAGEEVVLRVALRGRAADAVLAGLDAVRDALSGKVDTLILVDETESGEDYAALAGESTSLGLFIRRLNQEIADAPTESKRAMLTRAREVGLNAYRGQDLPVTGLEGSVP